MIAQNDPPEKNFLEKKPLDYWIDFPLLNGTEVIGKFTIPCNKELTPERFQMFDVLASIVGGSLLRVGERERQGSAAGRIMGEQVRKMQGFLLDRLSPLEILRDLIDKSVEDGVIDGFETATHRGAFIAALDALRGEIENIGSVIEK